MSAYPFPPLSFTPAQLARVGALLEAERPYTVDSLMAAHMAAILARLPTSTRSPLTAEEEAVARAMLDGLARGVALADATPPPPRKRQGVPPYGYKRGPDGEIMGCEDERAAARTVHDMKTCGASWTYIADEMNRREAPGARGGVWTVSRARTAYTAAKSHPNW